MLSSESTFYFESFSFEPDTKELIFTYSYDKETRFTETILLNTPKQLEDSEAFTRALFNLHLALGISYWKAFTPKKIIVESGALTKEQAEFWNTVYTEGLGEFYYTNQIDFNGLVEFPYDESLKVEPLEIKPFKTTLLPLGGGKDSLVSVELLQQMGITFDTTFGKSHPIVDRQVGELKSTHIKAIREVDEQLFELNEQGAQNGHIPISMIYAFTTLLIAIVQRYKYIVFSNERSANEGNTEYLGQEINHQWSKSARFENLFRDYVHSYISPEIEYFSLLRPLSELHIAKLFASHEKWLPLFTSCNTNFKINDRGQNKWCGNCPKDAFVFAILAPFVSKEKLVETFGKNMFADTTLLDTYKELLGTKDIKPLDCVGTPNEVRVTFAMAHDTGLFEGDATMDYFVNDVLPTIDNLEELKEEVFTPSKEHNIPEQFQSFLDDLN